MLSTGQGPALLSRHLRWLSRSIGLKTACIICQLHTQHIFSIWVMSCNHGYCNKVTIETTLTKHRCAGQHLFLPLLVDQPFIPRVHKGWLCWHCLWPWIIFYFTVNTLTQCWASVTNYVPTLSQLLCQHCISCLSPVALLISIRGDEKWEECQGGCHGCHRSELTIAPVLSSNWSDWTKEGSTFIMIIFPVYFSRYF